MILKHYLSPDWIDGFLVYDLKISTFLAPLRLISSGLDHNG